MKTFLKLLLAVVLITIIALGVIGYNLFSSPTTAEIKEFFSKNQSAFAQKNAEILSAVAQKKSINSNGDTVVGYQWLEVQPELHSYQNGDPLIVRYYTHLRGIGVGSFGTGIAYIDPRIEEKGYPDLEAMTDDAKKVEGFIGYSKISGHWYCFFWEAD